MLSARCCIIVPDQRGRASLANVKSDLGVEAGPFDDLVRVKDNPGPGQYSFDRGDYVVGPDHRNQRLRAWVLV